MSDPSIADLEQSLTRAIVECETRLHRAHDDLSRHEAQWSEHMQKLVVATVPDLSAESLARLRQLAPAVINSKIAEAFRVRKYLGMLITTRYRHALYDVQIALRAYLDSTSVERLGQIAPSWKQSSEWMNSFIVKAKQHCDTLALRREELRRIYDRLSQERQRGRTTVPRAVVPSLDDSVQTLKRRAKAEASPNTTQGWAENDDFDLWLYFLTDIPSSARTWFFSAVDFHPAGNHANPSPAAPTGTPETISFSPSDSLPTEISGVPTLLDPASAVSAAAAVSLAGVFDPLGAQS